MNGSGSARLDDNPAAGPHFLASFPALGERGGAAWEVVGVLALLALVAASFFLGRASPLDVCPPRTLGLVLLAGCAWLVALGAARRMRAGLPLVVIFAGALALRLCFLWSEPEVSDDLHRYVWEGALLSEGGNPYAHAPASAELAQEQERWRATFERVNHPEVPAAYPPLTLLAQATVVTVAGGPEPPERARHFLRLAFALCDLAVCVPLLFLLRERRVTESALVAWAWNPWVALEFAGSGHFDALGILLLVLTLALWSRPVLAAFALAAGAATKLLPLALAPTLLRSGRPVRAGLALGGGLLLPLAFFVLVAGEWPRPRGLAEYAFRWESFSLAHRWIEGAWARVASYDEGWSDPRRLARASELLLWLAPLAWAWRRRLEPARVAWLAVAGFLLLTPTLHPWYLCWAVPFLALFRVRAFAFLVAFAPLFYWPLAGWRARGEWHEPSWLWPLVALPFGLLLVFDLWRARSAWRR